MSVLSRLSRFRRLILGGIASTGAMVIALAAPGAAFAAASLTQISSDTFTAATCTANTTTNHHTEVEPDTFSNGSNIVATFQVGRVFDGGSCDIGFATTTNNGGSWSSGVLPCITKFVFTGCGALPQYDRVSDPSVAYDAQDGHWVISSLALLEAGGVHGAALVSSSSSNATGTAWNNPVTIKTGSDLDKNWTVCDNTPSSPFYGNCYTEWDDHAAGNKVQMSTSTDGGATWGAAKTTRPAAAVIGGQPLVQPNGTVAVPIDNASETALGIFTSSNGGSSWSSAKTITSISHHATGGNLREGPLPSAEIDGAGKVYVVWSDCRFRSGCTSNDLVMASSTNLTSWTISQIPITLGSGAQDYVIPGIAVDKGTSGSSAHLVVTFYYQSATCTSACQLSVGSVSSTNGGSSWGAATTLVPDGGSVLPNAMPQGWMATTSQGRMVGDYISTSFGSTGTAFGVFAGATAPTSGANCSDVTDNCVEGMYTTTGGLASLGGSITASGTTTVVAAGGTGSNNGNDWVLAAGTGARHAH